MLKVIQCELDFVEPVSTNFLMYHIRIMISKNQVYHLRVQALVRKSEERIEKSIPDVKLDRREQNIIAGCVGEQNVVVYHNKNKIIASLLSLNLVGI
jgi:hypothetical protein